MKEGISILITAFQAQDFIDRCLYSIETQTYFKDNDNYEVLIGVDGCEPTLTAIQEIMLRRGFRNIRVFMMDSNKGTFITMNTLIDLYKYNQFIRFDADDIMRTTMVERIMDEKDGYDLVRYFYHNFHNNGEPAEPYLQKDVMYGQGCSYFKRRVFDVVGGYMPWLCGADSEILYRIERTGILKTMKINEVLFERRLHDHNLTISPKTGLQSPLRKHYANVIKNMNKGIAFGLENPYLDKVTNTYKEVEL